MSPRFRSLVRGIAPKIVAERFSTRDVCGATNSIVILRLMGELWEILLALGVKEDEITADRRLRAHLALDSTETVELEQELHRRFGVVVDLWDRHDFTVAELAGRIKRARAHGTKGATGAGAAEQD